ncbi:MAG: asparagine synthase-related protein, partial [Terracidiphilus sp.]
MLDGFLDDIASAEDAACPSEHLLRCIRERGVESLYARTGFFALAVVDRKRSITYLMKDRLGSKPLFYANVDGGWCWASEIKCIQPFIGAELDRQSLPEIFHYRWLAGPRTLLSAVRQVLPGHVAVLGPNGSCETHCYWKPRLEPRASGALNEFVDEAGSLLLNHLRGLARRYPRVGIPLSAGVDSALLSALASQAGFSECVTISARYPGWRNPELEPAAEAAQHLKLEHLIVDIDSDFIARTFRPLLWRLEEPSRHYHVFPLSAIFEKLSSRVDLVLYGEGADTVFGPRSLQKLKLFAHRHSRLEPVPAPVRHILAALALASHTGRGNYLANLLRHTPESFIFNLFAIKSHTDPARLISGVYHEVAPNPEVRSRVLSSDADSVANLYSLSLSTATKNHLDTMDRISAPSGITVALPFLSHEVIDLGQTIPL